MMFQLRRGYEVDVTVAFTDDSGNSAAVDGVPVWSLDDPSVFTLVAAEDGLSAVLQGTGETVGATTVLTLTADADLGEGVVHVTVSEDVQLVSGQATTASFGFGEPRVIAG
jgi:hypothetical protein